MIASKNSWHAKLYNFTYGYKLPKNLCPYFWKLVFAIIIFIPNFIFQLPVTLIEKYCKKESDYDSYDSVGEKLFAGIMIYATLTFAVMYLYGFWNWILWLFDAYSYNGGSAAFFGLVTCATAFGICLYFVYKTERKNILVEFVKAKYNNYCPQIDWV